MGASVEIAVGSSVQIALEEPTGIIHVPLSHHYYIVIRDPT